MALPVLDGGFTGPLRIDIALRFDALGGGPSQPLVALGATDDAARLTFGQSGSSDDLLFELVQGGTTFQVIAQDVLVDAEQAVFTAQIDDSGTMAIFKDAVLLAQTAAEVPLGLPTEDVRGAETAFDAVVTDLTIEPLSPAPLDGTVVIVAHPDDDLLFMNPTIAEEITAGDPVTTVYLTAGDAGQDASYWEDRESGAKAAYALMAGVDATDWVDETVTLNVEGAPVEVQSSFLDSQPEVRLYFLRTPDGIDGGGTPAYGLGSLEQLWDGAIDQVTTVDAAMSYSADDLTQVIGAILVRHAPTDILLQDDSADIEHSDHVHTADFAESALPIFGEDVTVTRFQSYNSWGEEENLSAADVALVTEVFEAYAAFDPAVRDDGGAINEPYRDWILREYVTEQYRLLDGERIDVIVAVDPDPVDPGPEAPAPTDPSPTDPGPEDPAPTDPSPTDPGPEDPAPTDPSPTDPGPEDPTPTDPAPTGPGGWASDLYGADGAFGQLLSGSPWGATPGVPAAPDPTVPDPTVPDSTPPTDPTPTAPTGVNAFGTGGLYDQFLSGNAGKWATPTDPTPTDPSPTDPVSPDPEPTGIGPIDPFGPGGLYEAMMRADDEKWTVLDTPEDLDETVVDLAI
jgi:LmbE family N-acetylglucosaminyl deacetylase